LQTQLPIQCRPNCQQPINMSALKLLREVMDAPHNLVQYDTDTVSVTSTVENEEVEDWYNTECIIAGRDNEDKCYLVKWEDYPLDQQVNT
jgi:hypothetical protein